MQTRPHAHAILALTQMQVEHVFQLSLLAMIQKCLAVIRRAVFASQATTEIITEYVCTVVEPMRTGMVTVVFAIMALYETTVSADNAHQTH